MTPAWVRAKANALHAAWTIVFGSAPSTDETARALTPAVHETAAGDAWPRDHNWGACTKGALSAEQKAALARAQLKAQMFLWLNGKPDPDGARKRAELEAAATQALVDAGCAVRADQAIHLDSSPTAGAYFTTFGAFPDDVSGAEYFVRVLCVQRPGCLAVIRAHGSMADLAGAMFRSRYFMGFVKPTDGSPEAKAIADAENIRAYAKRLDAIFPVVQAALVGWVPEDPAPVEPSQPAIDAAQVLAGVAGALWRDTDPYAHDVAGDA